MPKKSRIRTTAIAAGCAITLSAMLGACSSTTSTTSPKSGGITGTAPNPGTTGSTGSTASTSSTGGTNSTRPATSPSGSQTSADSLSGTPPTPAGPPSASQSTAASVVAEFLTANQLPDAGFYQWSRQYITQVNVEHPLEPVCGKALGPEQNTSVWDARYPGADGQSVGEQTVHSYASASVAAARVAASFPTCAGLTAHTAGGFAWLAPAGDTDYPPNTHVLFANVGARVAVVTVSVPKRDYDPSLDAKLLQTMTQRLKAS